MTKYQHLLRDALGLSTRELAVLDVLMLRGPQTLGEIRTRAGRLFEFASLDDAEATLNRLIERTPEPLVAKLPRQPGQKEVRYAHLLSGAPAMAPAPLESGVADEMPQRPDRISELEHAVEVLRAELSDLRTELVELKRVFE